MPINLFSTTTRVTKHDYYGNPYEAVVIEDNNLDYGALWSSFSSRFKSQPTRELGTEPVDKEAVEKWAEIQLIEKEKL